jgi:DNA polymerase
MNPDIKIYAALFVAQRIEIGEKEWFFQPRVPSAAAKGVSMAFSHDTADKKTFGKPDTACGDAACRIPEYSGGDTISSGETLEELHGAVKECLRCSLGDTRTRFVFGSGNPHAPILFIGEAPGAEEDNQGLPFVGRAGQLLTKMIESIKLRREDVYIANILKCRPPGNRDPLPSEIEKCEPILIRQIEIIRPRIICALGRISGQTLLRSTATLGALREKVHDYHGVKLVVTYHPAALLRNPQWKRPTWEDLKFLRREYDGMEIS